MCVHLPGGTASAPSIAPLPAALPAFALCDTTSPWPASTWLSSWPHSPRPALPHRRPQARRARQSQSPQLASLTHKSIHSWHTSHWYIDRLRRSLIATHMSGVRAKARPHISLDGTRLHVNALHHLHSAAMPGCTTEGYRVLSRVHIQCGMHCAEWYYRGAQRGRIAGRCVVWGGREGGGSKARACEGGVAMIICAPPCLTAGQCLVLFDLLHS